MAAMFSCENSFLAAFDQQEKVVVVKKINKVKVL